MKGKSAKAKSLEEMRAKVARLEAGVKSQQQKILSRQFIRDADVKAMHRAKEDLEKDANELGKLKRKIERTEESPK